MAGVCISAPEFPMKPLFAPLLALAFAALPVAAQAAANPMQPVVAGQDYEVIDNGQPFEPLNGKVEVVEVFGYVCIHCAHFEPQFELWQAKQASDVRVTPVPAVFGGYWMPYARAYYAAQDLNVLKQSHAAVFQALHFSGELPLQDASDNEIANFYVKYGANPAKFILSMHSDATEAKLKRAFEWERNAQIPGTPTLIVDGKYRVLGKSFDDVLRIVDALVAKERAANAKKK